MLNRIGKNTKLSSVCPVEETIKKNMSNVIDGKQVKPQFRAIIQYSYFLVNLIKNIPKEIQTLQEQLNGKKKKPQSWQCVLAILAANKPL